ncbi:MAG: 50S ribosomal protein L10 [Deltaproteobacteria bacterium]|nr:50S ribosomal protein L10 [Deltaproteobacteria bacterium]
MNLQEKIDTVDELKATLARAQSLVLADFRGLTVEQTNGLRRDLRRAGCQYRVIKNTMVKRAIAGTGMEPLKGLFKGPTAIAWSDADPSAPAKVLDKAADAIEKLKVKGGFVDGKILDVQGVKSLAQMKGKDELRAELLMLFLAPATEMVRLLAAGPTNFMYLLGARERSLTGES